MGHSPKAILCGKGLCLRPTEEQILAKKEGAKRGWILDVDWEYPAELLKAHNGYQLAPEKKRKSRKDGYPITKKTCQMSWG